MERKKYAAEFKSEAVKQVIDKGRAVVDVAKRLGIPEGVLYGWVNKFKKSEQPHSSDLKTLQAEMVKLKAELRRTTEERYILKKAARTLPSSPGEVHVYASTPTRVSPDQHVPCSQGASQRLLRLAA